MVKLSDQVEVEWFRQVPPISELGENDIGVSGIGTIAAARVAPRGRPEDSFVVASMYATGTPWSVGAADASAHRILSDLSAFIGHENLAKHRILAAGDLNIIYGATGGALSLPERERVVWDRIAVLGLEFLVPQLPNGRPAATAQPDVLADTRNVPTYYSPQRRSSANADRQFDYAVASRGFHERIGGGGALNGLKEWGSSDHCRLLIEVDLG